MEPQKFRHRVDEIEAFQVTLENIDELAIWCNGEVRRDAKASDPTDVYTALTVRTMRGEVDLTPGYWLIRNSAGRFEGMTDGNFKAKYEEQKPEPIVPQLFDEFTDHVDQNDRKVEEMERSNARRTLFGRPDRLH